MSKRSTKILGNIDWVTIGVYFLLVAMGWFNIYSAVFIGDHQSNFIMSSRYGQQLIWVSIAVLTSIIILIIDSKFYSLISPIFYTAIVLLLIGVLMFGTRINGAKSWLVLGPIRLQPAEFAKVATALAISKFLSQHNLKPDKLITLMQFCAIAFFPMMLILMQNDTGSALVFIVFLLVFFREGMPSIYLIVGLLATILFILSLILPPYIVIIIIEAFALIALYVLRRNNKEVIYAAIPLVILTAILWVGFQLLLPDMPKTYPTIIAPILLSFWYIIKIYKNKIKKGYLILGILFASIAFTYSVDYVFNNVLIEHQQMRIKVLLGMESDPYGAGYNVNQSKIAIGSGGPAGKGYLLGTQTKFKFVPEQSTDFIFCTVGEEWGFLGTTTVLGMFAFLLLRLVFLAERQKSKFSRVYGYSVACIFFFHIAINVGMTIGLAPVIGIPLPFFSYGGSSLWAFTILLFIFIKLDSNREQLIN